MPFVSVTRLRLRSLRYAPGFFWYTLRSSRQAGAAEGNLHVALLNDAHWAFWTRTVWRDRAAMRAFMVSGPHRKAMAHLPDWCDEAALADWEQESDEPPAWTEVHRRMRSEGRRSQVKHPSPAQQRFEIPPPRS
jgi:hypothetical protein